MFSLTPDNVLVAARLRAVIRLANDLATIQSGQGPTAAQMANAPLITDYEVTPYVGHALRGRVSNIDQPAFTTQQLYLFDPDRGYARTLTRFYRLG